MKKMKGIFIILPITVISFLIGVDGVKADSYELKMVPYNVTGVCDLEGDEENYGEDLCFERYLKGELEPYLIKDNIVKEGQTIMLVQKLVPSSDSKLVLIQYSIKHDVSKVSYYLSNNKPVYSVLNTILGTSYGPNGLSNENTYYGNIMKIMKEFIQRGQIVVLLKN